VDDPFAFFVKSSSLPRACRLIGLGTVYFVTPSYVVTERLMLKREVAGFPHETSRKTRNSYAALLIPAPDPQLSVTTLCL
jgi:hypothetical protein